MSSFSGYIDYGIFSDAELLDLVDEHYFTLATTGAEAFNGLVSDIVSGLWDNHKVSQQRMFEVAVTFGRRLWDTGGWNTRAMDMPHPF